MASIWLFTPKHMPIAILPFLVYSIFHVATYTRTNLIPTLKPQQQSNEPGTKANASALSDAIGRFVKEYYDTSMTLVACLEIALWFRILGSAILIQKGSWILLAIYTVFFRARYSQSSFVQGAIAQLTARVDATVANQSTPPVVRQAWGTMKGMMRQAVEATDINKYASQQQPQKKAQ